MEITINALKKTFGQQTALDIQHLHIQPGELVGVVGNNGAGKTTLFRLLLDLLEPAHGHILSDGRQVAGSDHWKPHTGSYLDEGFLIDFMTPEEFFAFTGNLYGLTRGQVNERLPLFQRFMSGEILDQKKYIRQFSAGNRQKVGIVAAMLADPRLLILDEPFNFLDPTSQIVIRRMLQQQNQQQQTTMLLSSHNLNHIAGICTRIILLEKGKVIRDLPTSQENLREMEDYFSVMD